MGQDSKGFRKSINIKPVTGGDLSDSGDLGVDAADSNRLKFNRGTGAQRVLLAEDATTAAFTAANKVTYDHTSSGMTATEVQAAVDELDGRVDTNTTNIATNTTNIATNTSNISTHTGASTGVHGVTGSVVGTSDSQTLTNKTLTSPVLNTATADTITAIAGGALALAGVSNRNINLTTSGSGVISVNGIEYNLSNQIISANSSDLEFRAATGQNTKINAFTGSVLLQKNNLTQATITSTGIQLATGKVLSQGTGTTTLNTSGDITVPSATDTLVGKATTDTLTNKTIAAGSNTISGLTNSNLSGSAAITNANLATVSTATFKGRTTAGTGAPEDLTATQATALLNSMVGDSGSGGTKGLAPAPSSGDAAAGKFLKASGIWAIPSPSVANLTVTASQTTTYAIGASDDVVLVDGTSASFSATLPTAVGVSGKVYRIKRTDQTPANTVTIATTSSQTIDGITTRKLCTQYEEFTVVSDGANWQILSHTYPSVRTAYTPTFTGFGTATSINVYSWRSGQYLFIEGTFTTGTSTATEARMTIGFAGTSANVTSISALPTLQLAGSMNRSASQGATFFTGETVLIEPSKTYVTFGVESSGTAGFAKANGDTGFGNSTTHSFYARIPIANWES